MFRRWLIAAPILMVLANIAFADVSINGEVQTDNRVRLQEDKYFTRNENELSLKLEGSPSENLHFFSNTRLRGFGFPELSTISDLQGQGKEKALPWGLEMQEAYLDVYSFIAEDLDIRIGRQIISWGTADGMNPTSNLCPDDLEDIFEFGEKLGTNALKASYYQTIKDMDFTLTGVFVPIFTPTTLPSSDWSSAFTADMELPPGMNLGGLSEQVLLPERKPGETSSFGLKLSTTLMNYDVSLSYYYGRDKLPLVTSLALTPTDVPGQVNAAVKTSYPRMQVIGADVAGSIWDVGIWAEAGLFLPEETEMRTTLPALQGPVTQSSIALEGDPYSKFVVGGDYTFKNGIYVNLQYLHGFSHERDKDDLNDYFAFRLEKTFLNDELKLIPIQFAVVVDDWDHVGESYGFVYMPELTYSPYDNLELSIGAFVLKGRGEGIFSKVEDKDEFYFEAKLSF